MDYKQKIEEKRQKLVNTLIEFIEKNPTQWEAGWYSMPSRSPINGKTQKKYNGLNAFYLCVLSAMKGYKDPRWVTFNQAKDLGAHVRAGEKSSEIFYWSYYDKETKQPYDAKTCEGMTYEERKKYWEDNVRPVIKFYQVFNATQCENMPEYELQSTPEMEAEERRRQNAVIEQIITNSAAPVSYDGGSRAYYSPSKDSIHLPAIKDFKSMQDYYATALHEIAHSTGHESRLNRNLSGLFGTPDYAKEELRAELASVFMQVEFGISVEGKHFENHGAYLASWLKSVKDNQKEFFSAASDAEKITSYVAENYLQERDRTEEGEHKESDQEIEPIFEVNLPYEAQVDMALSGMLPPTEAVLVRPETPFCLRQAGFRNLPMLTTQKHIRNANRPEEQNSNDNYHGLSAEIIKGLPKYLENPVMIMDSLTRDDSVVVVTDCLDQNNRPIIVAVKPSGSGRYNNILIDSNFIMSFYGRKNFDQFVNKAIDENKLLYWDKEKSQELYSVLRVQFPHGLYNLDSDTIIHKSQAFVNTSDEKNTKKEENSASKERPDELKAENLKRQAALQPLLIKSQVDGWKDWSTDEIRNKEARDAAEWLIMNNYENEKDVKSVFYDRQTSSMSDDFHATENDEAAIIRVAQQYKAEQAEQAEKAEQVPLSLIEQIEEYAFESNNPNHLKKQIRYEDLVKVAEINGIDYASLKLDHTWDTDIDTAEMELQALKNNLAEARYLIEYYHGNYNQRTGDVGWWFYESELQKLSGKENVAAEEKVLELAKAAMPEQGKKPIVVNFYAGPGAGKTTAAFELTAALKKAGLNVEYVSEYAKELVLEGQTELLSNQQHVTDEQYHRLDRLRDSVDVIVTDSPVLLGIVYGADRIDDAYRRQLRSYYDSFQNIDLHIERKTEYQTEGRVQTEQEAKELDTAISQMLQAQNINCRNYMSEAIHETVELVKQAQQARQVEQAQQAENTKEKYILEFLLDYSNELLLSKDLEEIGYKVDRSTAQNNQAVDEAAYKANLPYWVNEIRYTGQDGKVISGIFGKVNKGVLIEKTDITQFTLDGFNRKEAEEVANVLRSFDIDVTLKQVEQAETAEQVEQAEQVETVVQADTVEQVEQVGQAQQVNGNQIIQHDNFNYIVEIYPVLGANADTINAELKEYINRPLDIGTADSIIEKISKNHGIDYDLKSAENSNTYLIDERFFSVSFAIMSNKRNATIYTGSVDNAEDKCGILEKMKTTETSILESDFYSTMEKKQARENLEKLIPALELEKSKINKLAEQAQKAEQGQQVRQAQQAGQGKWRQIPLDASMIGAERGKSTQLKMPDGEYSSFVFFAPTKFVRHDEKSGAVQLSVNNDFKYTLMKGNQRVELSGSELRQAMAGQEIGKRAQRIISEANAQTLTDIYRNVPEEMRQYPNWCVFKTRWNDEKGKYDKQIFSPVLGLNEGGKIQWASIDKPETWATFDVAMKFAEENDCAGLVFALDGKSGISCIDLDKAIVKDGKLNDKPTDRAEGEMSELATRLSGELADTYIETSASGNGIHIFVKDDLLAKGKYKNRAETPDGEIEVYDDRRFMSMTGKLRSNTQRLGKSPVATTSLIQGLLGAKVSASQNAAQPRQARQVDNSDSAVIERMRSSKRGSEFEALYRGENVTGDSSRSDFKLLNMLAFFTDCDESQMERIFRSSGLYREEKGEAYLRRSVSKACATLQTRMSDRAFFGNGNHKGGGRGNSK